MLAPLLMLFSSVLPQNPEAGAVAFQQACLDATTDAVVLNVAAHPDDESGRTMTLLRHKYGVRTVTLYSTCGEGGQNAIGREIGPQLAAIRVRETLKAAEFTGTEVRWLGFADFGYSKTMEETLGVWGKDVLFERMRSVLDDVAPDCVVTNHSIGRGHGHHQASAFAIQEACKGRTAETGRLVPLYQRGFRRRPGATRNAASNAPTNGANGNSDETPPKPPPLFALDPGEVDPIRGATFAKTAHIGWVNHASQGPWGPHDPTRVSADRWTQVVPKVEGETPAAHPLERLRTVFDEPAFVRAAAARDVDTASLRRALDAFRADRTRGAHIAEARRLLPILRKLEAAIEGDDADAAERRIARRIDALERVVVAGSGLALVTWMRGDRIPIGGEGTMRISLAGGVVDDLVINCDDLRAMPMKGENAPKGWFEVKLRAGDGADSDTGPLAELTETRGYTLRARFSLDGLPLHITRPIRVRLAPELALSWDREQVFVPSHGPWQRVVSIGVEYNGREARSGRLTFRHPEGLRVTAIPGQLALSTEQQRTRVLVRVECDKDQSWSDSIELASTFGGAARARVELVPFTLPESNLPKVGLVRGPDDTLHRFLEDLAIPFEELDETGLAVQDLGAFDTLLLDIRVYQHRPDLANHKDRLLEFCRGGGRVLVFYHKSGEWNPRAGKPLLSPFDLRVGRGRVSEERAMVRLLEPAHPLWTQPFQITAADFDGWVQERGLNFPTTWDRAWVPLIEMHDVGEKPLQSGLLYTRYGRGDYVYCSLALYRQIRRGHVGAARILLNLMSR